MMRSLLLVFYLLGSLSAATAAAELVDIATTPVPADRPNFLIILADDMGFSDAGCYGGEIATPNLDMLAANGLRYTQFYNTARCWPTRGALLTGYYPQQIRRDGMPGADPSIFGYGGVRPSWAELLPDRLRPLGYRSYHSGKWHIDGKPRENGFDRSSIPDGRRPEQNPDENASTRIADHAIECLREHATKSADRPFFQYLAFTAPHFPLRAPPEDIAPYRDRYIDGWESLRTERHQQLIELGITGAKLSAIEPEVGPPYDFPDDIAILGSEEVTRPLPWMAITPEQRRFQAGKMAIHAAMIDRMDREIGRVLQQLRDMGAWENTLIVFLSDNGASAEIMVRGNGHDPSARMGSADTFLCLGPGFSSAANTPFRRHKAWVHEGGISTPFIAHWPAGITARNALRSTLAHVIDIAPTVLELAGAPASAADGAPATPGRSLVRTFARDDSPLREALWFYHEGNWALRQGDWKIVHAINERSFPWGKSEAAASEGAIEPHWALYNLANDRAEQHDLAATDPSRVRQMAALWIQMRDQFIREAGAPTPAHRIGPRPATDR